jgi:hypothetical protein
MISIDFKTEIGLQFLNQRHALLKDGLTCQGKNEPIDTIEDYYSTTWKSDIRISQDPRARGHRKTKLLPESPLAA